MNTEKIFLHQIPPFTPRPYTRTRKFHRARASNYSFSKKENKRVCNCFWRSERSNVLMQFEIIVTSQSAFVLLCRVQFGRST